MGAVLLDDLAQQGRRRRSAITTSSCHVMRLAAPP
jgi:hypothetical protein